MANYKRNFLFLILFYKTAAVLALPFDQLKLPSHFKIDVYARVPDARSMTLGENNIVFVGSKEAGDVYALLPELDHQHAQTKIIASKLDMPNGVAFYQGDLYVAEVQKILRYKNISANLNHPSATAINVKLPSARAHGWRYIKFSPDGWLYVAIGAPCNACISEDPRFATIMQMHPDGTKQQIFAEGVRNSVGFAWDPTTKDLWFTDNGRDWLGDNIPPDELNHAPQSGLHFGFPYYYGNNIPDPKFVDLRPAKNFTPPALNLPAHVATLGMVFYTGKLFPAAYQKQIFIAEHGSWNRSQKDGYQVVMVKINNGKAESWAPFITGWLQKQNDWGRPVDLLVMPDGSMLISDDKAGVVYRVSYL